MTVYAFDHIRRYFWHHAVLGNEPAFKRYWRYMLMC
jgi:hypothetical protein